MKKLLSAFAAAAFILAVSSCAQKEEQRDQYQAEHNVDYKRNAGVDSAALDDHTQRDSSITR